MLRSLRTRPLRFLLVAGLLIGSILPSAGVLAQPADERFFSQTGYRIDNNAFWSYFQGRGGVDTFGYPVSRQFTLQGFPVQIFQRLVMQLQPDGGVATLNLLDQGLLPYTRINGSTFPAADPAITNSTPSPSSPTYADQIVEFVRATAPDVYEGEPVNFGTTFFNTVTCEDAFPTGGCDTSLLPLLNLEIWGAPTSNPARDPANSSFVYQRFQRSIMHYDATCRCTQGLLLADYLKALLTGQNLPPDLEQQAQGSPFLRQYAPGQPLWMARPADLPNTDLTQAFEAQTAGAGPAPAPIPAPAPPPVTGAPAGAFGYGFQVHMWDFSQEGKVQVAVQVPEAGFGWLKHQVEWFVLEPSPGVFSWGELDAIVDTARRHGVNILLSVSHAPTFYRGPSSGLMPADPSRFQALMQAMASRYAGRVQAYELWNEQNLAREAGPGNVDPSTYLPLLKAGYAGVKAGDPSAMALLGAPSPTGANIPGQVMDDVTYLTQLFALNNGEVKGYYDVLSGHPSGFSNPPGCEPETPECSLSGGFNNDPSFFAFNRMRQYRQIMVDNGESAKKIWFTEFGYCSNPTPPAGYEYCASLTEQNQSEFLVEAFSRARDLDYIGAMFVWNLNFQMSVPQTDEKWGFGVIRSNLSPRPAYSALQGMPKR